MGIAASSAVRAETTAGGPAYGSLEALGGPRKFKKKPVLVLDSDELEKAHAMFQEASAELLGEDVERAPRPAPILGLAPMEDDDPEEMGTDDEVEDCVEDDLPAPEDVLALTRRKTPAPAADVFGEEDDESLDNMGDMGGMSAGMITPSAGGSIDDDIDLENRIFPSLPVQPELAEEGDAPVPVEPVPVEAAPKIPTKAPVAAPVEQTLPDEEPEAEPEPELEPDASTADPIEPDWSEFREANPDMDFGLPPSQPDAATSDGVMPELDSTSDDDFDDFDDLPPPHTDTAEAIGPSHSPQEAFDSWQAEMPSEPVVVDWATDLPFAAEPQHEQEAEGSHEPEAHRNAQFMPDLPPAPEPDQQPASGFDPSDNEDDAALPETPNEASFDEDEEDADYTAIEDDRVDGYAFMRDQRSRRSAVMAAQEGRQSALRAKLLREAAEDAAQAEQAEIADSQLVRAWNWLRAKFSRKG